MNTRKEIVPISDPEDPIGNFVAFTGLPPAPLPVFIDGECKAVNPFCFNVYFQGIVGLKENRTSDPADEWLTKRFGHYTFFDVLLQSDGLSGLWPFFQDMIHRTGVAVLAHAETCGKLSKESPLSLSKLSQATRDLYRRLGVRMVQGAAARRDVVNCVWNTNRGLCASAISMDLEFVPDEFFGAGAVAFFSALTSPPYQNELPKLTLVAVHDGLPVAVFDPEAVDEKNVLLVAAAYVSFATCLTSNLPLSPSQR